MSFDLALSRITHDMEFHSARDYKLPIPANVSSADVNKFRIWAIDGADKVAQQIKINLLSFLGEWFLDIRYGVPYLEEILVKNPRLASVETILRNHIGSVPDVIRVDFFGMDWSRKDRSLRVEFSCETTFGPIRESVKLEVTPYVRG